MESLQNIAENNYEIYDKIFPLCSQNLLFEDLDEISSSLALIRAICSVQIGYVSNDIQFEMVNLVCNAHCRNRTKETIYYRFKYIYALKNLQILETTLQNCQQFLEQLTLTSKNFPK